MAANVIEIKGLDTVVNELKRRNLDVRAGLETICNAGADVVLDDARARAPDYVADNLGKRTTARSALRVVVSVGPQRQKKFAVWAEYGIKAHEIQPKRRSRGGRQALSIPGWGVYRRVHHPGVAKRPFLRPAYEAQSGNAQDAMSRETKRLIRA